MRPVVSVFVLLNIFISSFSQIKTNSGLLKQIAAVQAEKERVSYQQLVKIASEKGWQMRRTDSSGNITILVGVDMKGMPQYISTENNTIAAATIGTNNLWPGGSTGLNLNGSSNNVKGKLALWDGGKVRSTHQELTGRILQKDFGSSISDHSTHVAGTLIASGVYSNAKGMSFGMQQLVAYDFSSHISEMMNEAPNLLVSNHSYGSLAGWNFNESLNRWEFLGLPGQNEDYKFGYYSTEAQLWDSIAYNAPNYLIVKSSGNNRDENGPAVGQPYWRSDGSGNWQQVIRDASISSNNSYDIITTYGTSKNILTVGAINPIANGYKFPTDVVMSSFSSWGPTDDGRIKPDVVADGVGLLSSIGTADDAYASYSGTSMSSPNTAGSVLLLQEYYSQLHGGNFMRSATLKGIIIHTADEAGSAPGPDYRYGWGLVNMKKAAAVITANNTTELIQENVLNNGDSLTLPVITSGNGTLSATISWTDPKANVVTNADSILNNRTPKLVNDLDIVIKKGTTVYKPWILFPAKPDSAASTGDNILDNVEKIELPDVVPGESYTIEVKHKGTLERGQQAYSLIVSGVGGNGYCASGASNSAGSRIDSVSFANIHMKNPGSCTTYNNFTAEPAVMQPSQSFPVFIRLNSCDASSADKILKIFIDTNNDGDFDDADETLAISPVLQGNADYTTTLTLPAALVPGKFVLMRIVIQETNSAASVTACGTYTKGETEDFRISIIQPSKDAGIISIVSPATGDCKTTTQNATVNIQNFGSAVINNIPVSILVKQGSTTIASLNETFTGTINPGAISEFTLQTPFQLAANTSYSFTATTNVPGDQIQNNDSFTDNILTGADATAPTGTASICGSSASLKATSTSSAPFNWYSSATSNTVLTTGANSSTTTLLTKYYLSTGEVNSNLGPVNKLKFTNGGYNQFSPAIRFTTFAPLKIQTARLYIGTPGKIIFYLRKLVSYNESDGSYTYIPISTKVLNVSATKPTAPVLGAQDNDPADTGAIYYLGFDVHEAGDYLIAIGYVDGASIFRNNLITGTNFPYTVPGLISITGNTAFQAGTPDFYKAFYYYFYNIVVIPEVGCPSGRTEIVASNSSTPVVTAIGNVLSSTAGTSYQWYLNGVIIPGAINQNYSATESGSYKVQTTVSGGCTLFSDNFSFTLTGVNNVNPAEIGMIVSPNPVTNGRFNLQLETRTRSTLNISLLNSVGQKVFNSTIPDFVGRYSQTINPGEFAAGIYFLLVQHDKKTYLKKLVFQK